MASSVKVVIRTRPTGSFAQDYIGIGEDKKQVTVRMPKSENPNAQDTWSWKYDSVLHNASQETVYSDEVAPIVASVLRGYNGTIMCYGQTGAGKTFTQLGSIESYRMRGIMPRAIADVFQYIADQPQYDATVSVSYVEIHNDALYDLLSTLPTDMPVTEPLTVTEDKKGETVVKNLLMKQVTSEEEALAMLFEGTCNRQVANHQLNRHSTRGHAIFTLHIRLKSRMDSSGAVIKCKLNLVDLAGSERLKKTDTSGNLRSESMYINKSLSYLEQVVIALSSKGRSHTPYRQSKLTHLLKDSLGGNCKTLLIACIYGELQHLEETISTLQFAARVLLVPNDATINQDYDAEQLLKRYALEIHDLKRELAMHDALASRSRVAYAPYSDAQREELMATLTSFLDASGEETPEMTIESVRQMQELLVAMKMIYTTERARLKEALAGAMRQDGAEASDAPGGGAAADGGAEGEGVGSDELTGEKGISIGKAPDHSMPAGGLNEPPSRSPGGVVDGDVIPKGGRVSTENVPEPDSIADRQEAYGHYKITDGAEMNAGLNKAKKEAREWRLKRAALAVEVNEAKRKIDDMKAKLHAKQLERGQNEDGEEAIIDEEEYTFIQSLKAAKVEYKAAHEAMTQATASFTKSTSDASNARAKLMSGFEEWYATGHETAGAATSQELLEPGPTESAEMFDNDEAFEALQMSRIMAEAPESLAFVRARSTVKPNRRPR